MQALRFAAREAITDALERGWKPGPVVGVIHSLVLGDVEMWSEFHRSTAKRVRARQWVNMMPSTVICMLMKENDFHGPAMSVSAMCASGNAGVITAKSWLDSGLASDVVLVATDPSEVAYLNAHGPGTAQCDAAEARVLDELFPQARGIFSIKPLVGHCQAAASAVEILATVYAFQTGFIPSPPQVARGHPRLLDGLTPRLPGLMVKSSIGMGGYNSAIVLGEPEN